MNITTFFLLLQDILISVLLRSLNFDSINNLFQNFYILCLAIKKIRVIGIEALKLGRSEVPPPPPCHLPNRHFELKPTTYLVFAATTRSSVLLGAVGTKILGPLDYTTTNGSYQRACKANSLQLPFLSNFWQWQYRSDSSISELGDQILQWWILAWSSWASESYVACGILAVASASKPLSPTNLKKEPPICK